MALSEVFDDKADTIELDMIVEMQRNEVWFIVLIKGQL
jgi:hypothetical protein